MFEALSRKTHWPHAPTHIFKSNAAYIVTSATYNKTLIFNTSAKLDLLQNVLFEQAQKFNWTLQAWAIMANHYHFVA